MKKQTGQTFIFGAILLIASNILVKLIGACFRIPLTNIIHSEGMGYFNGAYNIYVMFYNVSTAGIPVAVSRMVSASVAKGNYKEAQKIYKIALRLFLVIGSVGTALMIALSKVFANNADMPSMYLAIIAIAPTVFFICVSSAYRGFFQGMSNMIPTAVSQVIEAVGKLGIGIAAALFFTSRGTPTHVTVAFVISGVSIGVALSTFYAMGEKIKFNRSPEFKENLLQSQGTETPTKRLLKELVVTAIPITLASSIMGLTNLADTMFMTSRLIDTGLTKSAATSFYGVYSSMVIPLLNLVPPFIYPFAISAIPVISSAIATKDNKKIKTNIESAFRNCAIISIPCAIGIGSMAYGIIKILFKDEVIVSKKQQFNAIDLASPALTVVAGSIIFLGIISITNAILQAYRFEKYTIVSTVSGIAVKVIVTYFASGIPNIGLLGSALGTLLCYFTIMSLNLFFIIKKTKYVPHVGRIFVKPLISGILCGAVALGVNVLLSKTPLSGAIATIASIGAAGVTYVVTLLAMKGLSRDDVMMMPKGEKLCRVMDKFNLLEKQGKNEE